MGLFGLGKDKKMSMPKKENAVKKHDDFEVGSEGIKFTAVIELLGSPKKYVSETLQAYVDKIKKDSNYHIYSSSISKPQLAEKDEKDPEQKNKTVELFSAFAELEMAAKQKSKIFDFCFNYMPSSIEVTEPMNVVFSASEMSRYLTDIQGTLHQVDFALKQTNATNQILNQRAQNITANMVTMLQNNIVLSLREGDKEIETLVKNTGVPTEQLKPFLDKMIGLGDIKQIKDKYSLVKKK